ncbi:MAG: DUF4845 domain-containing protein [Halioglobus sp.]
MVMRHRQSGMSLLGMLSIAIMVGFFIMCGMRLAPSYFEYLTVKEVVTKVATEYEAEKKTIRELRRQMENLLNTNQVYDVDPRDIEIYRKDGKTWIDANYEARISVMGRIDAVMSFDDLKLQVGQPAP